ncbi:MULTISPECIES: ribosome maturation factor RimM [unclassified Fusibacter]|uniref:ribosome maturation factor RimM n=1 Tax=unclassified Fusibacter TaxID=2624464 RepID=UPI0010119A89|nr:MULTISPECIES: ribosome maturation factor RimM [unclassified Fusibacter]MCK8058093.1 ribosome maturation factor RimM [Fusibacter sp. A2]NPE20675.1 16S rRNA processing protein RimM [Fusibacter sp. A1]RXV62881.1 16S rRNA processing protein RimM [Fusibacter sp. A1]
MSGYLTIGKIVNTHALKGEVKVYPFTSDLKRFEEVGYVYLDKKGEQALKIVGVKYQKNMLIIKFEGYNHINDVERLKNRELYIDRETQGANLEEEEFYVEDLIGLDVVTEDQVSHGVVTDVIQNKSQDLLEIQNGSKRWFLPFVEAFVVELDFDNKKMVVELIEGLIDEN